MVRRGLVANARNAWPAFQEFEALGPSVVRTIVYDDDSFDAALQVVPPGVDVIALLSSEHEGIGAEWNGWIPTVEGFAERFKARVFAVEIENEWDTLDIPASKIAWLVENASAPLQQAGMLRLLPSVASDHWQSALVELKNLIHLRDVDGGCLVPDQRVTARGVTRATMRRYEGDVVTIQTTEGNQVTCTPNHPILTRRGWVPAHLIDEHSEVAQSATADSVLGSGANDIEVPTAISKVFAALKEMGMMAPRKGRSDDFHGDGRNGNVDVVTSHSLLRNTFAERGQHLSFMSAGARHIGFSRYGYPGTEFVRLPPSDVGQLGSLLHGQQLSQFLGALEPEPLSVSILSCGQSASTKQHVQSAVSYPNVPCYGNHRFTRHVSSMESMNDCIGNRSNGLNLSFGSKLEATFFEERANTHGVDSDRVTDVLHRLPGDVTFVKVAYVGISQFHGSVYNLSTEDETIIADGIVTHNCLHPYGQFVAALGPPQPGYKPGLSASVTRASGLLGGVPIYVTEFGAKLSDYGGEDRQAEYVRVAYDELDLLDESRCPLACFFAWHDAVGAPSEQGPNAFGLARADGSRRPAWYAYQTVAGGKRDPEPVPIGDYRYQLGFKQIADAYPSLVGVPVEDEYGPARGMSLQRTSTGMLYWASLTDSGIVMGFVDWRDGTRYRWAAGGLMKVAA